MSTIDSKVNKQIAKNLSLEGMDLTKEQQGQILDFINNRWIVNLSATFLSLSVPIKTLSWSMVNCVQSIV